MSSFKFQTSEFANHFCYPKVSSMNSYFTYTFLYYFIIVPNEIFILKLVFWYHLNLEIFEDLMKYVILEVPLL